MSGLSEFISAHDSFYRQSGVEQILTVAWFLEARESRRSFASAHMRKCLREVGVEPPDLSVYLPRMARKSPPQLMKEGDGFRLSGKVRRELDKRYGGDPTVTRVSQILTDLPAKIPNITERAFLMETLNCYRVGAFRAATVMAWNLAYDHLTKWAVSSPERLAALNDGIKGKMQGKAIVAKTQADLIDLGERRTVECCQVGGLIDKNQTEILLEKLKRRNAAAHPSNVVIGQHQVDDTISDLVNNVVLALT